MIYTNHCIRDMTATAMYKSGYSLHDIAQVTSYKNLESLKYYLEKPMIDDVEAYSDSLFRYASKEENNNNKSNSNDKNFEAPSVKTRNVYDEVKGKKAQETSQNEEYCLVPYFQKR